MQWSPYLAGAGIGVLSWLAFLLSNEGLGASSAFARTAGLIEKHSGVPVEKMAYYKKLGLKVNWGMMLMAGVICGAFLSAWLSGDFRPEIIPILWERAFGDHPVLRWLTAFIGGIILIIGARWAGGCTSGHGITGALQLAVSGWLALAMFFVGGVAAAHLIYGFFL